MDFPTTITIKELISVLGLIVSILILVIAIWKVFLFSKQLKMLSSQSNKNDENMEKKIELLRNQIRDQHEWYRREKSLQYSGLFHPRVKEVRLTLDNEFNLMTRKDPVPLQELIDKININKTLRSDINYLLTYYENIAIACKMGVADEEIIKLMLKGSFIRTRIKLFNYIEHRKEQTRNPLLWINFLELGDKWKEDDKLSTPSRAKTGLN